MKQLDKWDTLMVRACKCSGKRTLRRLRKIFAARCDLNIEHVEDSAIRNHLVQILIEAGKTFDLRFFETIFEKINPPHILKEFPSENLEERIINSLIFEIMILKPSEHWENYHAPARFRK